MKVFRLKLNQILIHYYKESGNILEQILQDDDKIDA